MPKNCSPNTCRTVIARLDNYRQDLEFGPASIRNTLEVAGHMIDEIDSSDCSGWVNHRTIGALLDCARLATDQLSDEINDLLELLDADGGAA